MVELSRSLAVTRSAVGVLLLPAYVILSPPMVSQEQCGLSFWGTIVAANVSICGLFVPRHLSFAMKKQVLMPLMSMMPRNRRPSSLAKLWRQMSL